MARPDPDPHRPDVDALPHRIEILQIRPNKSAPIIGPDKPYKLQHSD